MTEKLYYINAYIKEFSAKVISSIMNDKGCVTVLDKTAFFPKEGGQDADRGYINDVRVIDVYELDGVIYHVTESVISSSEVNCRVDFEERFEKMQLHTAEHILCGLIHKKYGYENVGFHLGEDFVTFDVDGVLTKSQIYEIESLANEVVFSNQKISTWFPLKEELSSIEYRSKLDLTEDVRLVKIGDVDICACCAPHVGYTGEIGIIKILDFMKHRNGTRITMTAGRRALLDYREKEENVMKISAMLSAPKNEIATELERYMDDVEQLRQELKRQKLIEAERMADSFEASEGNNVIVLKDYNAEQVRAFANVLKNKTDGLVVCLTGSEGNYKYLIMTKNKDLSRDAKDFNTALRGRGGGRGEMISGTFNSTYSEIAEYFK